MTRVIYDPSASSIVVDLLLEASDAKSSLLIPVVLDTGASLTIVATDIMSQLGYDPANPRLGASGSSQAAALNTLRAQPYDQPPPLGKRSPIWKFYATTFPQKAVLTVFLDSVF